MAVYIIPHLNRSSEEFITKWQTSLFGQISEEVGEIFARHKPDDLLTPKLTLSLFESFFGPRVVRLKRALKEVGSDILWDSEKDCPAFLPALKGVQSMPGWPPLRAGQIAIKIPDIADLAAWKQGGEVPHEVYKLCEDHALPGNRHLGGLWGGFFIFNAQVIETKEPQRPAPPSPPVPSNDCTR